MGTRPPVSQFPGVPRSAEVGNAPSCRDLARLEKWSDASPSWTSCPWSTSVGRRPRRPSASRSRCARRCSARATTGSPRRWCSPPPTAARRPPVRMTKHESVPDRYDAWVTPDVGGAWTFEVHAWSDPIATWEHNAGLKIPAGVDVELMFEEGRLLCEKVLAEVDPASTEGKLLQGAIDAAGDPGRPPAARLAVLQDPALVAAMEAHPIRELRHDRGPLPGVRRPPAGAVQQLVRVLPALGGRHPRRRRHGGDRHLPDGHQAARRGGRHGLRRHLPAADPPDRGGQPQGPQQHADPGTRRPRVTVGDRLEGRRPRRRPPRPRAPSRTSTPSSSGPATSASRSRSTWPCSARPTTRGSPATRSSSPRGSTAPSPTPRTRRRSTRTSTR